MHTKNVGQADLQRLLDMVNLTKSSNLRHFIVDYFQLDADVE
ncbi:MAG: hypothetical protein ABIG44_17080 [Planctomycetota bacterium]